MAVTITCTKKSDTTITAQANADSAVTWTLEVTPSGGGPVMKLTSTDVVQSGIHTATWNNVPAGTYRVTASTGDKIGDSEPVPFGTCT